MAAKKKTSKKKTSKKAAPKQTATVTEVYKAEYVPCNDPEQKKKIRAKMRRLDADWMTTVGHVKTGGGRKKSVKKVVKKTSKKKVSKKKVSKKKAARR